MSNYTTEGREEAHKQQRAEAIETLAQLVAAKPEFDNAKFIGHFKKMILNHLGEWEISFVIYGNSSPDVVKIGELAGRGTLLEVDISNLESELETVS